MAAHQLERRRAQDEVRVKSGRAQRHAAAGACAGSTEVKTMVSTDGPIRPLCKPKSDREEARAVDPAAAAWYEP